MRHTTAAIAGATLLVLMAAGCAAAPAEQPEDQGESAEFVLSSPDLDDEGYLPEWGMGSVGTFCDGENRSPELSWEGAPEGTEGFVVTLTDPAFPSYVHWVVTGIPADVDTLASAEQGQVAEGVVGRSSQAAGGYVGPCVADNEYIYTVYALDEPVVGDENTTLEAVFELMRGHTLDSAELGARRR